MSFYQKMNDYFCIILSFYNFIISYKKIKIMLLLLFECVFADTTLSSLTGGSIINT